MRARATGTTRSIFRCLLPFVMALPLAALAADIQFEPAGSIERLHRINISGEIVLGDAEKLRHAIQLAKSDGLRAADVEFVAYLNSPGGIVGEALRMGRILRDSLAWTAVVGQSICSSSCVFIFSGGVRRLAHGSGQFGLHRPRFDYEGFASLDKDSAFENYSALQQECVEFMRDMGIPDRVFEDMLKIPSQEVLRVSAEEAERIGLVGSDPAYEEWIRATAVRRVGLPAVKAQDRLQSCLEGGASETDCIRHYQSELKAIPIDPVGKMIDIPGGSFQMGQRGGLSKEDEPTHTVRVRAFRLGMHEVTQAQWGLYCADVPAAEGCRDRPTVPFEPAVSVSYYDVQEYLRWLKRKTGQTYRLPTEAEWEYAARAGTTTEYPWGNAWNDKMARGAGANAHLSIGDYPPNAFGLYDMIGNAWELTEDCWHDSYRGAPTDGSAWASGACDERVIRGGDWSSPPAELRVSHRSAIYSDHRYDASTSFRLAQDK